MSKLPVLPGARRLLILLPVAIGVAILVLMARSRGGMDETPVGERTMTVRVVPVARTEVVPRVIGYGVVRPGRTWQAVAQVAGRIVSKDAQAEAGAFAAEGSVLFEIDPRAYELAVRETEARIAKLEADLAELATRESNTERTLEIEKRSLAASERELARKKGLAEQGVLPQTDADQEESRYLQQLVKTGELENNLKLVPAERKSLEASLQAEAVKLEVAQLDLSYTRMPTPFRARLVRVDAEEAQYVSVGQTLAEAHGMEVAEVVAQVPVAKMRHLIPDVGSGPEVMAQFESGEIIANLGLSAVVRMRSGDFVAEWAAEVTRISAAIDPETRTLGVVVAVAEPYRQAIPGVRPPLVQDMFCEVELRGRAKPDRALIPRAAVHDGEVFVAEDGRLRRRKVDVDFQLKDLVCLSAGLDHGEVLVVSDPIPAIEGMLLDTLVDTGLAESIARIAAGEGAVR